MNLNPRLFVDEVLAAFEAFISTLKAADPKRCANFKAKFLVSYGIDTGREPT